MPTGCATRDARTRGPELSNTEPTDALTEARFTYIGVGQLKKAELSIVEELE
jgi:hypothetical protein